MKSARLLSLALVASAAMLFQSAAFAVGTAYSGSWYNPDESGHGFTIEYGVTEEGNDFLVAYWYVYDTDGNPIFLLGMSEPDGNNVEIHFDAPYGMIYGEFDPDTVALEVVQVVRLCPVSEVLNPSPPTKQ